MKRINEWLSILLILPLLFFTSKYIWVINLLVKLIFIFLSGSNLLYIAYDNYEFFENWKEIIQISSNILFSEGKGNNENFADEFSKSVGRMKDFISITQKGSYPEDFSYEGIKRDDSTITYSKIPGDWGINEDYDFGKYSDISKRKESAAQAANWLEYDRRVNSKVLVSLHSEDQTFNFSGKKWFMDYCKDKNMSHSSVRNDVNLRESMRNIAEGKQ